MRENTQYISIVRPSDSLNKMVSSCIHFLENNRTSFLFMGERKSHCHAQHIFSKEKETTATVD